ncbi:Succinyl-CoA--L-malate CoA-transferase alpha subunit [Paraburkholderia caffeinitolerans]|uniref:Succinyl-CoA--L-malate CoA-transferase alpha subunit n=1 Tax=Paraburkholderia caffeinitolerans TaxID=1723730 RepID=A0A6J5GC65_9BURK|nr:MULTISPECIES: CaiB/BaiF CoA-transferase family protein [Paraburkholderia]CAB3793813.1 Succinyl-CoA--L-malate CoA-transferase alpha subunit [Paraburkholderia caffeinitolerans]
MVSNGSGPLQGLCILEIAGLGPAPVAAMLLADLGADVVLVDRKTPGAEDLDIGRHAIQNRGKRSIAVDLKTQEGVQTVLELVQHCDAMIEGMRPGVMERLGLGPDVCLARNPKLVYGRMTGWGQDGPLAQAAGHDLNYVALSGALWWSGQPGEAPMSPPSLVGDIGGGALYLVVGLLAGIMSAREKGQGQVVDAAIVDGSAHMLNLLLGLKSAGQFVNERGRSLLDGPHWYRTYRCADGNFVSIAAAEPRFNKLLLQKLGLADDPAHAAAYDPQAWAQLHERFAALFATRTRDEWCALLEGTDACFAPVLNPDEAAAHPHMAARGVYSVIDGVLQANPAPRFSGTPAGRPRAVASRGEDAESILSDWCGSGNGTAAHRSAEVQ